MSGHAYTDIERQEVQTRCQVLLAAGLNQRAIADAIGCSQATVSTELRRVGAKPTTASGERIYVYGTCRQCGAEIKQFVTMDDRRRYGRCYVCAALWWSAGELLRRKGVEGC